MTNSTNIDLKKRALNAVRKYGVQLTHFRGAMNEWVGLNETDLECLRLLFSNSVSTPSELARQTGLTSGATTAMLDRLEKAASWFESARKAQEELIAQITDEELEVIS